jgi:hypothetical protein
MRPRPNAREEEADVKNLEGAVIACALEKADFQDREDRWLQLGQRAGLGTLISKNGLRLLFHAAPGVEDELRQLAELERHCCTFAQWSVQTRDNQVMLDVTSEGEQGIAAVQAMFKELRSTLAATYR